MSSGLYQIRDKNLDTTLDLTRLKPYGDTMNDGKVQTSFTLPVKDDDKGAAAAVMLAQKMGLADPNVALRQKLDENFTFYVVYGSLTHSINYNEIVVQTVTDETMDMHENDEFLKERLGRIVVGYTFDRAPVTAHDLHAEGAMTALLKDAISPNLVQTLEGTPAFVHGGPFANIAHGCNSIMATRMAMALGDYCVTEAGFGADLGAEKFLDIKCRLAGLKPDAVVVVATVRALKNHGGVAKADLNEENLEALEAGLPNLLQHVENITNVYNLPCVVAINAFPTDTKAELDLVEAKCRELGVNVALSEVWARGGEGGLALADEVVALCENGDEAGRSADTFTFSYEDDLSIAEKIEAIAKRVYHADGVVFEPAAQKEIAQLEALGFGEMPVCMAKTQYSFSDDATKLGAPRDFQITVRQVKVSAGAGFIVALTGSIMTMPGLGKAPAAHKIDVMEDGTITGLF